MAADDDDMPDIVDVVMEMGRPTPQEQRDCPEEAPSPPLPVPTLPDARLPGHLEELAGRARDYSDWS